MSREECEVVDSQEEGFGEGDYWIMSHTNRMQGALPAKTPDSSEQEEQAEEARQTSTL